MGWPRERKRAGWHGLLNLNWWNLKLKWCGSPFPGSPQRSPFPNIHGLVSSPRTLNRLTCVTNRMLQKWQHVTSEAWSLKERGFHPACTWITPCGWRKPADVTWGHSGSPWRSQHGEEPRPPTNSHVSETSWRRVSGHSQVLRWLQFWSISGLHLHEWPWARILS